jgi:TonB-dependent receptor
VDAAGDYIHNVQGNLISFSELDDDIVSGGVDVAYTLPLSSIREAIISAGVASFDNNREATRHDLQFEAVNGLTDSQRHARVDYLFSDYNINPNTLQLREIAGSNGASAYDAELQVNAAYAMIDAEIIPLVRTTVGVRFEDGQQSVTPRDVFGGASTYKATEIEEQYWLPSFTATWNFAEDQQLRFGASKTIGRPQFRELAPQAYTDPESDRIFIGNPYLVDTELLNLDARYEWYFARQQFITAGVFYKDMDKPVESVIVDVGNQRQQSFLNAPKATIMGAEVEVKKYFEFPDQPMAFIANKRWLVQANYTYSDSEVKVSSGDTVLTLGGAGTPEQASFFIQDGSRLQGQSDHVANLQLGWEDDTARSQATIIVKSTIPVGFVDDVRQRLNAPNVVFSPYPVGAWHTRAQVSMLLLPSAPRTSFCTRNTSSLVQREELMAPTASRPCCVWMRLNSEAACPIASAQLTSRHGSWIEPRIIGLVIRSWCVA